MEKEAKDPSGAKLRAKTHSLVSTDTIPHPLFLLLSGPVSFLPPPNKRRCQIGGTTKRIAQEDTAGTHTGNSYPRELVLGTHTRGNSYRGTRTRELVPAAPGPGISYPETRTGQPQELVPWKLVPGNSYLLCHMYVGMYHNVM